MRIAALWAYSYSCVVALGLAGGSLQDESKPATLARSGVCLREGSQLVGVTPARIDKRVRQPKKIRDVRPKYPALPSRTRASSS
jgi:hypothetical protein